MMTLPGSNLEKIQPKIENMGLGKQIIRITFQMSKFPPNDENNFSLSVELDEL